MNADVALQRFPPAARARPSCCCRSVARHYPARPGWDRTHPGHDHRHSIFATGEMSNPAISIAAMRAGACQYVTLRKAEDLQEACTRFSTARTKKLARRLDSNRSINFSRNCHFAGDPTPENRRRTGSSPRVQRRVAGHSVGTNASGLFRMAGTAVIRTDGGQVSG
jgi:hypothetical protein